MNDAFSKNSYHNGAVMLWHSPAKLQCRDVGVEFCLVHDANTISEECNGQPSIRFPKNHSRLCRFSVVVEYALHWIVRKSSSVEIT